MVSVCMYFQVHQPYRLKRHTIFDIGNSTGYFNDKSETDLNNEKVMKKVAEKSYLPTNKKMLDLIKKQNVENKLTVNAGFEMTILVKRNEIRIYSG